MLKFFALIMKNLGRNKLRTTLTALAVTVMVTICAEMLTIIVSVRQHVEAEASQSKLLVTERWVAPSQIPARYVPALTRLDGVVDWTIWNFYAGYFDQSHLIKSFRQFADTSPREYFAHTHAISNMFSSL